MATAPGTKKLQLDLPAELHFKFKALTTLNGETMISVLQPFIEEYVREQQKKHMIIEKMPK